MKQYTGSWVKNLNLHKEDTEMAGAMIDRAQVFNIMIDCLNWSFRRLSSTNHSIMNIDFVKVARQLKADGVVQVGKEF